jgi:putative protein kinase ArgK-like GTPase of G3E family
MQQSEGRPSFVFVTGAPGTGKSAMLDKFAQHRQSQGDIVIAVTFNSQLTHLSPGNAERPVGPFSEFLLRFIFS